MMERMEWIELLLSEKKQPDYVWQTIAEFLANLAMTEDNPAQLHKETVLPDRLLCEAAYPLWDKFLSVAPRTSDRLIQSCQDNCAVLILDALSIREMSMIVNEAENRGISVKSAVTFSESPSDTNTFAQAIGATARISLKDNGKSSSFKLFGGDCYTDVVGIPFADVAIPPQPNLVIWHSYLDDVIHQGRSGSEVYAMAKKEFSGDGFWSMIDKLRQGRKVIITSDHGYGVAEQFSSEIKDSNAVGILKSQFKAQRYAKIAPPQEMFMPPFFVCNGEYCIVTGQRKWKAPGGFPKVCHGGLSLLEVASPWIELNAK